MSGGLFAVIRLLTTFPTRMPCLHDVFIDSTYRDCYIKKGITRVLYAEQGERIS